MANNMPKGRPNIKTVAKPANRKGMSCYGPAVPKGGKGGKGGK